MIRTVPALKFTSKLALAFVLASCGDKTPEPVAVSPTPAHMPVPQPAPTPTSFNVTPCLTQTAAPGRSVADLVVPDLLRLDLMQPAGFPNGRRYLDPVIDITLAVIFLDLRRHPATVFANLPVNPNGVDQPLPDSFPFLAPPLGNPPSANGAGSNFQFRTDPASAYVRVDRGAMPGVSTALISGSAIKNGYNDDTPAIDATSKWVPEISNTLTILTNALADDFGRLGLTICATPN